MSSRYAQVFEEGSRRPTAPLLQSSLTPEFSRHQKREIPSDIVLGRSEDLDPGLPVGAAADAGCFGMSLDVDQGAARAFNESSTGSGIRKVGPGDAVLAFATSFPAPGGKPKLFFHEAESPPGETFACQSMRVKSPGLSPISRAGDVTGIAAEEDPVSENNRALLLVGSCLGNARVFPGLAEIGAEKDMAVTGSSS